MSTKKIQTANAVARYFLSLVDEEAGDAMSNLKLQKLLYYAQGFSLVVMGGQLFDEPIEAWTHGPVVPEIYHMYKGHGSGAIPPERTFDPISIDEETRSLLDEVYEVYGQYSAWKLRNMTHEEAPWADAYRAAPSSSISHSALRNFFETRVQ